MPSVISKYIIIGLLAICLISTGLFILERFKSNRLTAANERLQLSLDSYVSLSSLQDTQIIKLNAQLAESNAICNKRLEAREQVKLILKKPSVVSIATDVPQKPQHTKDKDNDTKIITFDESLNTIRYLNRLFWLR